MKLFTDHDKDTVNISTQSIVRLIILVVVAFLSLYFVRKVSRELVLFGIAAFLALALNPAVSWLSRRLHIKSRVRATGLAYIVVLAILAGFLSLVVPPLVRQTNTFVRNIPDTISNLKDADTTAGKLVQRYKLEKQVDKVSKDLTNRLSDVPSVVVSTAGRVGSAFVATITVIILTFMILVEGPLWMDRIWAMTPTNKRKNYKELVNKMYGVVTGYVNGQVLIAAIAAMFAFIALVISSHFTHSTVNAVALAGIVFLFGLIPLVGNTIAAVIVVIACLFTSVPLAIIMAIYFPIYQQLENATLQPLIQARSNQLTPLLVFMAALLGAGFGGLLGAFVAIPLAGCIRVLLEYKFGDMLAPTEQSVAKSKN